MLKKKSLLSIFLILIFLLPLSFSTQTLTINNIPSPADNPQTISWTYSDSTNDQSQLATLWYSSNPSYKNNLIASNLNLNNYCSTTNSSLWLEDNNSGLGLFPMATANPANGLALFNSPYDTNLHIIYFDLNSTANRTINPSSYTWDGNSEHSWYLDYDLNNNLQCLESNLDNCSGGRITVFTMNNELYAIEGFGSGFISPTGFYIGKKWNNSLKTWENNEDINKGLPNDYFGDSRKDGQTLKVIYYNGKYWFLVLPVEAHSPNLTYHTSYFRSYDWNGSSWNKNNSIITDLNITDSVWSARLFGFFNKSGILSTIKTEVDLGGGTYTLQGAIFQNGLWTQNNDINYGLIDFHNIYGAPSGLDSVSYNGETYFAFYGNKTATQFFRIFKFKNNANIFNNALCSYSWDNTLVSPAPYYIDLQITNGLNNSILTSSNRFTIASQNYYSGLIITDIENITHSTDKNVVNLYPTDSTKDFKFSIDANGFVGTVFFKIYNTDKSLKQYFSYTCDSLTCVSTDFAFNDTITYGTGPYAAIQKIWNNSNAFNYSWTDSMGSDTTRTYWFRYNQTMKSWYSLKNSPDWDVGFLPTVTDYNGISRDLFTPSTYAEINNTLIDPLPVLTSNLSNYNFVLQFNAFSDSATTTVLKSDTVANTITNPTRTYQTATTEQRITVKDLNSSYLRMITNSASANIFTLGLYNLIERGYFTKDLTILDASNQELPVYLESQINYQYLPEGKNFRIYTEVNDPEHNLSYYEITVYIDSVDPANKIRYYRKNFDTNQTRILLNDLLDGPIDLTADAPNRNIRIAVRVYEKGGSYSEVQSKVLRLVQFPYFPGDFSIRTTLLNKVVGQEPKGRITIRDIVPETLRGVNLYIYQAAKAPNQSDYNTTFYINKDFTCNGFDCSFDFDLKDYLFPTQQASKLTVSALLTTQNEDVNSNITANTVNFFVFWKEFDYARILETIERQPGTASHVYNNTEQIGLTLQLRDTDLANLKNDLDIRMVTATCGAATGTCIWQDVNYSPSGYIYDAKTGFNYWFWKNVFLDANGEMFSDGSFHQFKAIVADKKNAHQNNMNVFLTQKCATTGYSATCDWNSIYTAFNLACYTPQALGLLLNVCDTPTASIVTETQNQDSNYRIEIDETYSPTAPTQELAFCMNTDQNNVYLNSLEQEIICGSVYRLSEAPIDKFDFYLANPFSDFSKDEKTRQYIKVTVPAEIIEFNDLSLMRQYLSESFHTRPTTYGELIWMGINSIASPIGNDLAPILDSYLCKNPSGLNDTNCMTGIVPNLGFDFNFSHLLDPTFANGVIFFKVKGIKVLNQQDYVSKFPDLNSVNPKDFIEYMQYKGRTYTKNSVRVEILGSDMIPLMEQEVSSPLIINTPLSQTLLKKQSSSNQAQYESIPTALPFNAIIDLTYNGETTAIRRYIQFVITAFVYPNNSIGNLGTWFGQNWFFILLLVIGIVASARVYAWVKPANSN